MGKRILALSAAIAATLSAAPAFAQDSESGASGSLSLSTESGASAEGSSSGGSWLSHYTPEAGIIELGVFGGIFLPARDHNLRDDALPYIRYKRVAPEIGLRAAYFPLSFVGVEGEGAVMPTKDESGGSATLWALRAHAIGQLPGYRITPFALVGLGRIGAKTDNMGDDGDPSFHFGLGVKAAITKMFMVRLDGRDNVTSANPLSRDGAGDDAHHLELLLGLSLTLGRSDEKPQPKAEPIKDTDGDGFMDPDDKCPTEPGVAPDGCPVKDTDGDGFIDPDDKCPTEAGVAPDGCPVKDTDGDGFMDPDDKCPTEPGVAPDGCPVKDTDGDGIMDPDDKCPKEPETKNGFEDEDGCPDELPEAVKKFTGVIKGIEFDKNKATIRADVVQDTGRRREGAHGVQGPPRADHRTHRQRRHQQAQSGAQRGSCGVGEGVLREEGHRRGSHRNPRRRRRRAHRRQQDEGRQAEEPPHRVQAHPEVSFS